MIMLNSSSQVLAMSKVAADNKLPNSFCQQATLWTVYPKIANAIPLSKTFAFTGVSLLTGLSCNFFEVNNLRSDVTHTLVSSSPPLKILPLEYMPVLESNWNQLVNVLSVKSRRKLVSVAQTNTSFLQMCNFFLQPYMPHYACIKLYDHSKCIKLWSCWTVHLKFLH